MKNLVTENKDINKSVSLRLSKSLLEEINTITEVFSISLTDFILKKILLIMLIVSLNFLVV